MRPLKTKSVEEVLSVVKSIVAQIEGGARRKCVWAIHSDKAWELSGRPLREWCES